MLIFSTLKKTQKKKHNVLKKKICFYLQIEKIDIPLQREKQITLFDRLKKNTCKVAALQVSK